jgi:hypothetical protein
MSYCKTLEAAGAVIHCFEEFGSYQGDWLALVTYQGKTGWVNGSYGSCSGCDSFQAEFGYYDEPENTYEEWKTSWRREEDEDLSIERYEFVKQDFLHRYSEFGEGYLESLMTQQEIEKHLSENLDWDMSAQEMLDFVIANNRELYN